MHFFKGIKAERKIDSGTGKAFEDFWPQAKKVKIKIKIYRILLIHKRALFKMLSDMKFLDSLREYDKGNLEFSNIVCLAKKN